MPPLSATSNRPVAAEKKIRANKSARPAPAKQPGPISDAENRSNNAYKRTRPFYRANVAAFQHRPKVQKINKRATAAKKTKNKAALTKAFRAYGHEQRRGPDKFSNAAYRYYTKNLWKKVKGEYPDPEDRPGFKVDYKTPQNFLAFVKRGSDKVHYNPQTARNFMVRPKYKGIPTSSHTTAATTPLHEWTHTRQSKRTLASKAKTEGGATANQQRIAKKFGMASFTSTADYERWAALMKRKYGSHWIAKGQFR